jgi:hypothetical protein
VAQQRGWLERPPQRWRRLRRGCLSAAPRLSRRSLSPRPGSAVLPGSRVGAAAREPMRPGELWASAAAAAATTAPSGLQGFAADPGAALVPSGGGGEGFRLQDDPPRPRPCRSGGGRCSRIRQSILNQDLLVVQ